MDCQVINRMKKNNQSLLEEFEPNSKEEWILKTTSDLKGKSIESLASEFEKNIVVSPYYTKEDLKEIDYLTQFENALAGKATLDGEPREWVNYQKIYVDKEGIANKLALQALELGATGIIFSLKSNVDFEKLLEDILLDACAVSFEGDENIDNYLAYAKELT